MKSQLYIPKKCKVGFNLREDTYTGKLGYVIYHDGKIWRKEPSWESWRQKEGQLVHAGYELKEDGTYNYQKQIQKCLGDEIKPIEFDNVPTEGFVLNKKVGGVKYDWNVRQTYCRIYDPRGFEFEITIPNLLFILQETNSIKGKGLEGEFVYSWDGKDIVLLPTCSNDYKACTNFTELQTKKVSVKDLKIGATYNTKKEEKLVYLGKFNFYAQKYTHEKNPNKRRHELESYWQTTITNTHVFYSLDHKSITPLSSLTTLAQCIDDNCINNYAELMDIWNKDKHSSCISEIIETPSKIKFRPLAEYEKQTIITNPEYSDYYGHDIICDFFIKNKENNYTKIHFSPVREWSPNWGATNRKYVFKGYQISYSDNYVLNDNILKKTYKYSSGQNIVYSLKDIENMNLVNLSLKMNDGKIINIEQL